MKKLRDINPFEELYLLDCKGLNKLLDLYRLGCDFNHAVNWNNLGVEHKSSKLARDHYSYIRMLIRKEMTSRDCPGLYKRF